MRAKPAALENCTWESPKSCVSTLEAIRTRNSHVWSWTRLSLHLFFRDQILLNSPSSYPKRSSILYPLFQKHESFSYSLLLTWEFAFCILLSQNIDFPRILHRFQKGNQIFTFRNVVLFLSHPFEKTHHLFSFTVSMKIKLHLLPPFPKLVKGSGGGLAGVWTRWTLTP